jgi:pyrimidine-nucleoside phosphorylase
MAAMSGKYKTLDGARNACVRNLQNGKALKKFTQMIKAQGGDPRVCEDLSIFPRAGILRPYKAKKGGYLQGMDTMGLGLAANALGAGRASMADPIDPAVGFVIEVNLGDRVSRGQTLLTLHANDQKKLKEAGRILDQCFAIGKDPIEGPLLIKKVIE